MGNDTNDTALERCILHGLACEWEQAVWMLPPGLGRALKKPLFALENARSRWGRWQADRREITLSRRLVLDHPWDAVREVLHHEMAHQLAQEVLGGNGEPPHGPVFRRACALLQANPEASGRCPTLYERLADTGNKDGDRTLRRIRKLMALAESGNRHEAEAAMVKARELMARHHIEQIPRNTASDFISIFVGRPALRHFREFYHLAPIVTDFYFVQGIWVTAYVLERRKMGRVLEISGTRTNVTIASYVHDFVERFIDTGWTDYNRGRGLNRHRKTDFAVGILHGFRTKLEKEIGGAGASAPSKTLMALADPALDSYMAVRYPRVTRFSRQGRVEETVYGDGVRIGKKLVISKGVTDAGTGPVKRIPGPRR
ncbi:MAG: DUF2786 domain-containing protein [Desulfobacterales bacterium]|nr:DUF2786 domain-containing protein [Desulfobacterales bacterium]